MNPRTESEVDMIQSNIDHLHKDINQIKKKIYDLEEARIHEVSAYNIQIKRFKHDLQVKLHRLHEEQGRLKFKQEELGKQNV